MNNIIVNADDFGARPSVNRAVVELFHQGIINSATLMANMPGFEEAVELAQKNRLTDKIGVHLVLTEGLPLTEGIKSIPYLFNRKEFSRNVLVKKLFFLSKNTRRLIFDEYSRQIEKVKKGGIKITHLDTHQHMHEMWGVMQILIELAKVHNIPCIRILNNLNITACHKYAYRNIMNRNLRSKKLNYTDYFGSRVDFLSALEKDPGLTKRKTVEIMVHPDYTAGGKLIDLFPEAEYDFDFLKKFNIGA